MTKWLRQKVAIFRDTQLQISDRKKMTAKNANFACKFSIVF